MSLTAMRQWGDRWAAPAGPPLAMRHASCGHIAEAELVCSHCGETLHVRSMAPEPGPGARSHDLARTRIEGRLP